MTVPIPLIIQASNHLIIAIDGPAASGKSTLAKIIAKKLGINYINTGLMYRAVTYKCLHNGINSMQKERIIETINSTSFDIVNGQLLVDSLDFSPFVSSAQIETNVSAFAKIPEVRNLLIAKQREIASIKSAIMDGRDIGTVVFPDADIKIFLIATSEARARRRFIELEEKYPNEIFFYKHILEEIKQRDKTDSERAVSPLIKAQDAIEVDTTNLTIAQTVTFIENLIKEKQQKNSIHK